MLSPNTLSQRLRRLAWLSETGDLPARYADRLHDEADRVLRRLERDAALRDLAAMLPPGGSRWETAGALVAALVRFQATAWPRVRSGARPARAELERRLADVLRTGPPPCQRIIWEALREQSVLPTIERARSMASG